MIGYRSVSTSDEAPHPTALRVQRLLRDRGLDVEVRTLADSTRSAADAAAAIGCELGQIVKSLVFVAGEEPLVCLCAGDRRVASERLAPDVRPATPEEVRAATGFAIGGVPPLGHERELRTVVDSSLRRFELVWAAAGTPRSVFAIGVEELIAAVGGEVRELAA
jgi:prolyl-tRNA editing enzyme YbaK/EbsC (Cys-tRNA(Pro) deacylase)